MINPTSAEILCNGKRIGEANHYRREKRDNGVHKSFPSATRRLEGRYLWGGMVFNQFGHFVVESPARLWALPDGGCEGVVMVPSGGGRDDLRVYERALFDFWGVDIPIHLLNEPTEIEDLLIPGQAFGLGEIARGTPEHRDWMRRAADRVEPEGAELVYISRGKLKSGRGQVLLEDAIERNLERCGYRIYDPQRDTISQQLAQFKKARHILGLDSSAFHLAGLVAHPGQRYGIILRRNMAAYVSIQLQLEGMGAAVEVFNVLDADWIPARQSGPNAFSWGELDLNALGTALAENGFIPADFDWQTPTPEQHDEAVEEMVRQHRGKIARVAV